MEGFVDKSVVMEKCYVAFTALIPSYKCARTAKFSVQDYVGEQLAVAARMWLLDGHRTDVRKEYGAILFPKTPWQFFKQKYMPAWFKRMYPVQFQSHEYKTAVHYHYVCPHVSPDEPYIHYRWMGIMSGQLPQQGQESFYGEER